MAGIYIHIPYCKMKCHYCNFYTVISQKNKSAFLDALKREIVRRTDYLPDKDINTIYLGGGTPSVLSPVEIAHILNWIDANYNLKQPVEVTLEANPDDISIDYLKEIKNNTIVNRISLGVQSFHDDDLRYLSRSHDSYKALNAIEILQQFGFNNITIDLIYGIPTLTNKKWIENLSKVFSLGIPHLSSYALTIEPKTTLQILINKKKKSNISEVQTAEQFEILMESTAQNGFIHYEISNFAQPGFYSKHNSIYWLGGHYIGFGPSAHSFNGVSRQWNVKNMNQYYLHDSIDSLVLEKEILTIDMQYNEYVMTGLRTSWGCDIEHINNVYGNQIKQYFIYRIQPFIERGFVKKEGNSFLLSNTGKLHADGIASDLFRIN